MPDLAAQQGAIGAMNHKPTHAALLPEARAAVPELANREDLMRFASHSGQTGDFATAICATVRGE
ncbi:MAG: hypothetical protein OXN96_04005 [Bryobacterales bacterium]|nr:hypothetical protein [Bryobacterales bacterium]